MLKLRSLSRAACLLLPHAPPPPCAVSPLLADACVRHAGSLTAPRPLLPAAASAALAACARSVGSPRPISVVVDGNLDKAMRTLKRKMIESGLLRELKERAVFTKPSQLRVRAARPWSINPR